MYTIGKINRVLSSLSSNPPCPGKILPKSLTPYLRLIRDADKSPICANTDNKNAKIAYSIRCTLP